MLNKLTENIFSQGNAENRTRKVTQLIITLENVIMKRKLELHATLYHTMHRKTLVVLPTANFIAIQFELGQEFLPRPLPLQFLKEAFLSYSITSSPELLVMSMNGYKMHLSPTQQYSTTQSRSTHFAQICCALSSSLPIPAQELGAQLWLEVQAAHPSVEQEYRPKNAIMKTIIFHAPLLATHKLENTEELKVVNRCFKNERNICELYSIIVHGDIYRRKRSYFACAIQPDEEPCDRSALSPSTKTTTRSSPTSQEPADVTKETRRRTRIYGSGADSNRKLLSSYEVP
ncbi:hypothetical protein C0J52_27588 [Blattella germanica]|nr:hypothetical protein C0J52_27588 [Blattella germanica]